MQTLTRHELEDMARKAGFELHHLPPLAQDAWVDKMLRLAALVAQDTAKTLGELHEQNEAPALAAKLIETAAELHVERMSCDAAARIMLRAETYVRDPRREVETEQIRADMRRFYRSRGVS